MSWNEWDGFCDSCREFVVMIIPYMLATLIASVAKYFSRHYGKEPFSVAVFIAKNLRALFIGVMVACLCKGYGISAYLGVVAAVMVIVRGTDWFYGVVDDLLYSKMRIDRRKTDGHTNSNTGNRAVNK